MLSSVTEHKGDYLLPTTPSAPEQTTAHSNTDTTAHAHVPYHQVPLEPGYTNMDNRPDALRALKAADQLIAEDN